VWYGARDLSSPNIGRDTRPNQSLNNTINSIKYLVAIIVTNIDVITTLEHREFGKYLLLYSIAIQLLYPKHFMIKTDKSLLPRVLYMCETKFLALNGEHEEVSEDWHVVSSEPCITTNFILIRPSYASVLNVWALCWPGLWPTGGRLVMHVHFRLESLGKRPPGRPGPQKDNTKSA
jgi:hypothetical protein